MNETTENRPTMADMKGGFYFIATVMESSAALPADIADGVRLDRAGPEQTVWVKAELDQAARFGPTSVKWYETAWSARPGDTAGSTIWEPAALAPKDHRYFVLSFTGSNSTAHDVLVIAQAVAPYFGAHINFLTTEPYGRGGLVGWGGYLDGVNYYDIHPRACAALSDGNTADLRTAVTQYKALDRHTHEGILRAFATFQTIWRLSHINQLPVLGLFSVIEMLLTHNPNDKEIGDSLTHQIKTKMRLLEPRLASPLDYSPFGDVSPDKVWGTLYEYRSRIAHGGHIDFTKGLRLLMSPDHAFTFLLAATRALLRHTLKEPDLINALKPI